MTGLRLMGYATALAVCALAISIDAASAEGADTILFNGRILTVDADFSVREAIRDAVAAFGPKGGEVPLASPATGEAIFAAINSRLPQKPLEIS